MVTDPVFGLFQIPADGETEGLFNRYLSRRGGVLSLSPVARERGLYPICYRPAVTRNEKPHTHDFLELFAVVSGEGWQVVGDGAFPVVEGDVFFVNPARPHHFRKASADLLVLVVSFRPSILGLPDGLLDKSAALSAFELLRPFGATGPTGDMVRHRPKPLDFKKLLFHGFHLIENYFQKPSPSAELLTAQLGVLLELVRERGDPARTSLGHLTTWIGEHFREGLSVEGVARHFGVTPSWFSTRWNRTMGVRFLDHVAALRVREAQRLLKDTPWPIQQIAEVSGFANPAHFSTVFRRITGLKPRQWRETRGSVS